MSKLMLIAGGSALVYAGLAFIMGVLPGITLSRTPPGPEVNPLTPIEAKGRAIFAANGCGYCHTQQVRPLTQDEVFGRPSAPGDFAYQTPELLGSERTGPDLTNIGARQPSAVWQYIHLYNPRAVVPESIMPSFAWMFRIVDKAPAGVAPVPLPPGYAPAHGVVIPGPDAQALFAYLMFLKQPPLRGANTASNASAQIGVASPAAATTSPSAAGAKANAPARGAATAASGYDAAKGQQLFTSSCSVCHQVTGQGVPGVFPPLRGDPVVNDADASLHIGTVLSGAKGRDIGGVQYASEMPQFGGTLQDADIANIIDYERTSWGNHGTLVTAAQVAAQRATGK